MTKTTKTKTTKTKTHKESYPDQYSHPLVGRKVRVSVGANPDYLTGIVERVFVTCWGPLAMLTRDPDRAFPVADCHPID